jgi:hypothetical protein
MSGGMVTLAIGTPTPIMIKISKIRLRSRLEIYFYKCLGAVWMLMD